MKDKIILSTVNGLAKLPLGILYILSDIISFVLHRIVGYRKKVVRQNLTSAFPEKELKEIRKIEKQYYGFLGEQVVETLKLLHISDDELRSRVEVKNYEAVNKTLGDGKNAVLLMGHYCNWEWVQEIVRYFIPGIFMASIYHPLKNKFWDDIFIKIRSRWNAHIVPMKKAPRILLNKENMPWVCGFIADARPDMRHEQNYLEFLNHKTWFITGPEDIGDKTGADYFYLEMIRIKRGYYQIIFHPLVLSNFQSQLSNEPTYPYTREFWKEFETTIKRNPAYWLWSHKRWK